MYQLAGNKVDSENIPSVSVCFTKAIVHIFMCITITDPYRGRRLGEYYRLRGRLGAGMLALLLVGVVLNIGSHMPVTYVHCPGAGGR